MLLVDESIRDAGSDHLLRLGPLDEVVALQRFWSGFGLFVRVRLFQLVVVFAEVAVVNVDAAHVEDGVRRRGVKLFRVDVVLEDLVVKKLEADSLVLDVLVGDVEHGGVPAQTVVVFGELVQLELRGSDQGDEEERGNTLAEVAEAGEEQLTRLES